MKRLLVVLLSLAVLFGAVAAARAAGTLLPPPGAGYWHTSGVQILDANGQAVRIAGVNWYGMETTYWVPAGLDFQPYTAIMDRVKSLGYNAIRLPFSNELVESNPIVIEHVKANPQFLGRHALYVLDSIVRYAHRIGVKIILDDHVSAAQRDNMVNVLQEPLWYTPQYSQADWIRDWQTLARRYKGNDAVIGFDLRNEPHTNGPGAWDLHGYLTRGATWGPYHGVDNPATDWRLAAERAGDAILTVNPHLLIFVEGLQLYPDSHAPSGTDTFWWGSNLSMVRRYPVVLAVPHQLVYSTHDWGPWKWNMPWFRGMTYASLQRVWHAKWSYLLDNPDAPYAAPIWLGEFGTPTNNPAAVDEEEPGNQATWFHLLLQFLSDNREVGWAFWALNGTNARNSAANNGILTPQWNAVASQALQADLASIQGN